MPQFSVVTPSYNQMDWLRLCAASVADQDGVRFEHIVQDGGTGTGLDKLEQDFPHIRLFQEKDEGMYDAINRGLRRASGEFCSYLNCDEQYLPGALRAVEEFFERNPDTDVVFTDAVIVDSHGNYVCHRKALLPGRLDRWVRMRTLTCSMFFRRRILDERGLFFDIRWKALGDYFWVMSLIEAGVSMAILRRFTSIFTETGKNLALQGVGQEESRRRSGMIPPKIKRWYPLLVGSYWLRAIFSGVYFQQPFSYSIYTRTNPTHRVCFDVKKTIAFWKGRL